MKNEAAVIQETPEQEWIRTTEEFLESLKEPVEVFEFETGWGEVKCHDESFVTFPNFLPDIKSFLIGKKTRVKIEVLP